MISTFIFFAVVAYLAYSNGLRAKMKGRSLGLYAFLTVLLFFTGMFASIAFVALFFCRDLIYLAPNASIEEMNAAGQRLSEAIFSNTLRSLTVELGSFGGYLLVRYIVEHAPDIRDNNKLPIVPERENVQ